MDDLVNLFCYFLLLILFVKVSLFSDDAAKVRRFSNLRRTPNEKKTYNLWTSQTVRLIHDLYGKREGKRVLSLSV